MRVTFFRTLFLVTLLGLGLAAHPAAQAENVYLMSLAGGVTPRYEGSRDYRPVVVPIIAAEFDNGVFLNPLEGLGYRTQFSHGVFASVALGYDDGRTDQDRYLLPGSDHLKGMGDIPGSMLILLQVGVRLPGDLSLSATLDQPITETRRGLGGRVDLTASLWSMPTDQVNLTGSVHAGSDRYAQTFFGVTDRQSVNSRFDAYTPQGGVDSLKLAIDWTHVFTPHWMVRTTAGVSRLVGDAADSPIVQVKNNYLAMTALVYRY
ncbi:MipA/OmpV family protein [Hylemonella gracilis]|uniref:MipA family MltA-interacting protein n=1 Tax=Hylemonella gracilis ATCC 19624 TaxID=887062 RepID=F3KQC1_9BURK|nr:MipA/OmpV family protein [Hylemonella gracilis]EGI77994.1 MipA family MltA-interacting protein [Hylemonella gracilis ATCC 19624]